MTKHKARPTLPEGFVFVVLANFDYSHQGIKKKLNLDYSALLDVLKKETRDCDGFPTSMAGWSGA